MPRDPRLSVKPVPVYLSSSPVLHHKVPAGGGELRLGASSRGGQHEGHGPLFEGEQQLVLTCQEQLRHGQLSEGEEQLGPVSQQQDGASRGDCDDTVNSDEKYDDGVKTNMF